MNDQNQSVTIINNPNNKASATINVLPNELLPSIFKHLRIQDLIRCRLVCKRFMFFCDEVKVRELIVSNKIENFKEYWFDTNEQLNLKDAIDLRTFMSYRSTFRINEYLKRLHFKGTHSDYEQMNWNDLTHLEQLKIDVKPKIESYMDFDMMEDIVIDLPHLKKLEIGDFHSDHFNIYLITPQLTMLKCSEFTAIYVTHPNSIVHLETDFHSRTRLKNVQYLKVNWGFIPNADILSTYPKLTTLICNQFEYHSAADYYDSMSGLHDLIEQKRILKRHDLKIYYQSAELVDRNKVDEYYRSETILDFQINNFDLLCDNISLNDPLDYNKLMRHVNGELPQNFHKKYVNISSVEVTNKVRSKEHLVRFLQNFDYLNELHLKNTSFDQSFFDGLPEIGQLTILDWEKSSKSIANYNFLFKLKCLEKFETDHDFNGFFDLAFALFRELKYFFRIGFCFDKEYVMISKYETSNGYEYEFSRYTGKGKKRRELFEKRGMDFDQLVRLTNAYKIGRSALKQLI